MSLSPRPAAALLPAWPKRIRLVRRGAAVVSALAVLAELVVVISAGAGAGAYLALAVSAVAVALTPRHPAWGLVIAVAACGIPVAAAWDPTALWTIAVFTSIFGTKAHVPTSRGADLVVALATGKADSLSGRFLTVWDDLDGLVRRLDEIPDDDLLRVRLRK